MRPHWWVVISFIIAIFSFAYLYHIVSSVWPNPETGLDQPQLLLFIFMFVGMAALTIPISAYLNHRFAQPGWPERDKPRLLRQGGWVGLFVVLLAYLQLLRALNWTIVVVLAGVFILIETFFLTRG
jgi:hypothetical protein